MLKNIKNIFNDETELLDTEEISEIDNSFDMNGVETSNNTNKRIVRVFEPVTKTATINIIDAIKRGELCIVNFNKISEDEARNIYATLSGSLYSLEGKLQPIDDNIILCLPNNYLIDGINE